MVSHLGQRLVTSSSEVKRKPLVVRNQWLNFGDRTMIMGVVNVTPDSFSGDGLVDPQRAVDYALQLISDGADIIDFGGQSTRPGHRAIDDLAEAQRVIPVVAALRNRTDVIISIDTFSPIVLQMALETGADLLNSIWGAQDNLLAIVQKSQIPMVIMHNRKEANYQNDVVDAVIADLERDVQKALNAGLSPEQIILDPGIGFGKTADHNLAILASLGRLTALGFPSLIGTSRKSTIGRLTDRPVDSREFGTAATVALAIAGGIDIVRVHDVGAMRDVVLVSDAIVRGWRPNNWSSQETS